MALLLFIYYYVFFLQYLTNVYHSCLGIGKNIANGIFNSKSERQFNIIKKFF